VRLLVGLGNPGSKYERTRHNIGFRVAEQVARRGGVSLDQERYGAVLGTGRSGKAAQLAILLPQTFMNASGTSVGQAARFWKVPAGELVVVHDELDLEFGRLQVKTGGGDGGHNGLKSIKANLGTAEFVRVRFGIGRPPPGWDPSDWVLARFSGDEENQLEELIDLAAAAAETALAEGALAAMNKFNRRPKAESGDRGQGK